MTGRPARAIAAGRGRRRRPPVSTKELPAIGKGVVALAGELVATGRAAVGCAVFILKMVPKPTSPVDRVTARPVVESLAIPTPYGDVPARLFRPPGEGPHPALVACFGITPNAGNDPRIPQMGEAYARAGIASLLYCSPASCDFRLEPRDMEELVAAFQSLVSRRDVDPGRAGFAGICVGGAFALMAATDPRIRERVRFVLAYAPYSSMRTFAIDVASGSRSLGTSREPWDVDPLTWQVYVRTVTGWLDPEEARVLCAAHEQRIAWDATRTVVLRTPAGDVDPATLSGHGRAALRLLLAGPGDAEAAVDALPHAAQAMLAALSPMTYLERLGPARIILMHDRHDHVIPVGESRRLAAALARRPGTVYTELGLRHLKMPREFSPLRITREIARSYLAWYPLFRTIAARVPARSSRC